MDELNSSKSQNIDPCCDLSDKPLNFPINGLPSVQQKIDFSLPWIEGKIKTSVGEIPIVKPVLLLSDTLGTWKARWNIGRMKYRVEPGLYAVGKPTAESPVFVSANYKMSFDCLRSQLKGINAWIMVIDTRGINVWCAAGKGTFGADEIIGRIFLTRLGELVSHKRLIVPQLSAPGVSAHEVKKKSGFKVMYGPVNAKDIHAYMEAGMKATPEMRRINFGFYDRLVLVPNDIIGSFKYAAITAFFFLILSGLGDDIYSINRLTHFGIINALMIIILYIGASILPMVLLPWLPGRSFSAKGFWAGLILSGLAGWYMTSYPEIFSSRISIISWFFLVVGVSSFIAMNYTGSSTYTSLSGVKKEMKIAVPIQICLGVIGLGLWITGRFI